MSMQPAMAMSSTTTTTTATRASVAAKARSPTTFTTTFGSSQPLRRQQQQHHHHQRRRRRQASALVSTTSPVVAGRSTVQCAGYAPSAGGVTHRGRSAAIAAAAAAGGGSSGAIASSSGPSGGVAREPKRIVVFVEPTPFSHVSGMKNRFLRLIENLVDLGDDVVVVTPDRNPPAEYHGMAIDRSTSSTFRPLVHSFNPRKFLRSREPSSKTSRLRAFHKHLSPPLSLHTTTTKSTAYTTCNATCNPACAVYLSHAAALRVDGARERVPMDQ